MKLISHKLQFLVLMLALGVADHAFAQDDGLFQDAEDALDSMQIDIDGEYPEKRETPADRLEKVRKKLERKSVENVNKNIENVRYKEEMKLAKKLNQAFNGGKIGVLEEEAAPIETVEVSAPAVVVEAVPQLEKRNKIIPTFGVMSFTSDVIEFESQASIGIRAEGFLNDTDYISMGVGFNYTNMDIELYNYNSFYYFGREMNYRNYNLELNSKIFLTGAYDKFRPYFGAALAYSRTRLKFEDFDASSIEGVTAGHMTGSILAGMEIALGNTVGLSVDARYTKALTNGFSKKASYFYGFQSDNDLLLNSYGNEIEDADQFFVGAGLVLSF